MREYTPEQFAALLLGAAAATPKETVAVVRKGSINVERDAKRNVRQTAPTHNAHAFTAINFDVEAVGPAVVGEIGYDKSQRPGRLGNLLEFGDAGSGDHSPPHRDLGRALDVEEPRFEKALADMGERLLGE